MQSVFDAAIVGGGFFGCMVALQLRRSLPRVILLEAQDRLLARASYNNQARVHNGYHYPRSLLTALRSRVNFPRFVAQFEDCVVADFQKYYAVARSFSKVNARRFQLTFERIGAPITPAPERVRRLFNTELIEQVFCVQEYAFDAAKLARTMARWLEEAGVELCLSCEVVAVESRPNGFIALNCVTRQGTHQEVAAQVFNCSYSRTNTILASSGLPTIPLKHELTEMALVKVPHLLENLGITVMCGPFFSAMPFPPRGLHTLSHVRYTPHATWSDNGGAVRDPDEILRKTPRRTSFPYMLKDATRFLPALSASKHVDSLWEVKTVLPASESDDSRPILMRRHFGMPNLHCILGAKIDNVYDALDEIEQFSRERKAG